MTQKFELKPYSTTNIFARILRQELPCQKVHEDDYTLAFYDINPGARVHVLVIPKGPYVTFSDFIQAEDAKVISHFFEVVQKIILQLKLEHYRLVSNNGKLGGQEVPHFHVHILGA